MTWLPPYCRQMILRTIMRPWRIKDLFNINNDLFVRNDIADTILEREDIENKHEIMDITGPIQHPQ
jgi:hypothetical protein